jgi:maltose O-acetyltransferase
MGASPTAGGPGRGLDARRLLASALYLAVARHLPWSPRPGGAAARRLRASLARHMLDECGAEVNVEHGAWFGSGRGVRLGARSALGMDALVIGPLHVGDDVMMGPRCVMLAGAAHAIADPDVPMNQQGFDAPRAIVIEDDVWIGAGVTVLPGRRIGAHSVVGAAAVVTRDVPPYAVVGGNPARLVRWRTPDGAAPASSHAPAGAPRDRPAG